MATDHRARDPDAPLDARDVRAATEPLDLAREAPGLFTVYHDGREHTVDARDRACTCEDFRFNDPPAPGCKHIRRIMFVTGERAVPPALAADPQLGRQQARYGGDR